MILLAKIDGLKQISNFQRRMNMRNANESDMLSARNGVVPFGVVFSSSHGLVHRKPLQNPEGIRNDELVLMEHVTKNLVYIFHPDNLYAVPRGTAQQPRKPRRKPIKGTRPEKLIPMSEDVKLKVGDKVLLANGVRTTILKNDGSDVPYQVKHESSWNYPSGENIGTDWDEAWYAKYNITHKVVPWHEQHHLHINGKPATLTDDLKSTAQEKSPEQEAFENGFWVAHQAKPDSVCPEWAKGVPVEVLLGDASNKSTQMGGEWAWYSHSPDDDIVAFRKAKQ